MMSFDDRDYDRVYDLYIKLNNDRACSLQIVITQASYCLSSLKRGISEDIYMYK